MRIDKYLWCVRYYKTRNMATEALKKGQIKVNGQTAKPSREVIPTDVITIRKDQIEYQLKVLDIPQNRVGAKLVDLYRIDQTTKEALEHLELLKLSKAHYRNYGEGRPTKKDRRDIDTYLTDENDTDE